MNWQMITLIRILGGLLFLVGFFVILYFIIRAIWRAIKRFTFEAIDRTNGTSKPNYQDEARRACGKAVPKRDKNATPPWEE